MQFKSKAQLQAEKNAAMNGQMIVDDVNRTRPEATHIPLLTLDDIAQEAKDRLIGMPQEPEADPDKFVEFEVPDYPKSIYDSAHIENEMRDFNTQLGNANRPVIKTYTPPPVPQAIADATRREMEAGRQRVAEFAEVEAIRREQMANRTKEPWEGNTTQVFRPAAYVPDPKQPDRTGTLRVLSER